MPCDDKEFADWAKIKSYIHHKKNVPPFRERDIWWASIGLNIGYEIDGKNEFCDRPVLVSKKFSRKTFIGIPLSTKQRENYTRISFEFNGRMQHGVLDQVRLFDSKRLNNLMGQLNENEFGRIKAHLKKILGL